MDAKGCHGYGRCGGGKMFFTRIGLALAYIGFVTTSFRLGLGYYLALTVDDTDARTAAARRYLGTADTGEAIDRAIITLLICIALGVLCEISRHSRNY